MDTTRIGEVAAALMESVAEEHQDEELGEVLLIVESKAADETWIGHRCSDSRVWVQLGLLRAATLNLEVEW